MTLYSFDTSVLIESWNRRLPPATFVSFWERLDEVINAGTVRAVDEVRNELTRDDNLKAWAKLRGQLFVPLEHDIQRATTRVLEYAERMVGMGKGRNGADPFVIALAVARDGDLFDGTTVRGERRLQRVLGSGEVEVADVELAAHGDRA